MMLVDSSIWIDFFNGRDSRHTRRLRGSLGTSEIVVGDLMLCEVLQGLRDEQQAIEVEGWLRRFEIAPMVGETIAVAAAGNFRTLRTVGVTVRRTIDLLIGTWCIQNRMPLLHNDRDFRPMARYLGLVEVPLAP
jgi:predicted nucleic acid-binding protein